MRTERRQYERFPVPGTVLLNHENHVMNCQLENISRYGAYLRIGKESHSHYLEVGDYAAFSILIPDRETQELTGNILRIALNGVNNYLAVCFFQPYSFY
jgi:hypothetical protein